MSKTQQALAMMKETGCTAYAAAKAHGIATATLYEAIKANKPRCPCCGNVIRADQPPRPEATTPR